MRTGGSLVLLFTGLVILSLAGSMIGNALFPPGGSSIINSSSLESVGGVTSSQTSYAFLKPSDRVTISLQGNDSAGALQLTITKLADGALVLNRTSVGNLFAIFTSTERGTFVIDVYFTPSSSSHFVFNETDTAIGSAPTDFLWLGEVLAAIGVVLTLGSFLLRGNHHFSAVPRGTSEPPLPLGRRGAWKNFGLSLRTDLFQGRKIFFAVPIFLAITYGAGRFLPSLIQLPSGVSNPDLADLFIPSLSPYNDWLNIFPVVVVLAAYAFSYERDSRVLRSTLLNPIGAKTLFFARLTSMVIIVEVPVTLGILLTLVQFDPGLLASSPLAVMDNAPYWLLVYLLYGLVMIGFAILPAVFFRKPVYAFVVPIFIILLIGTEGFGLRDFLPWQIWTVDGTLPLSGLNFQGSFDVNTFFSSALPVLAFAFVLGAISVIVSGIQDKE